MRSRLGFTLVELMVVITIIVILLSLLVPSLERAYDAAETVGCQAKLDVMQTAMNMLLLSESMTFPGHRAGGTAPPEDGDGNNPDGAQENWWATDLFKYGMVPEAFHCTALKQPRSDFGLRWKWAFNQHYVGYGYNAYFLGGAPYDQTQLGPYGNPTFKLTKVVQPSQNLLVGDSNPINGGDGNGYWAQSLWWPASLEGPGQEGINDDRHGRGGVMVFNDGHTEVRMGPDINPVGDIWTHPNSLIWDPLRRIPAN